MSNSQITSQLTRVTVPSISDGKFADGIRRAFETINNNFKNIASLPFIQGVQGDSYTLISKDIWLENETSNYTLSKEGAVLLNSIFERFLDKENTDGSDTKKFHEGDSFDECKTNIFGKLSLNGVSPIDSFFTEEIEEDKPVKKLVNNKLYFYSVINNLDEEQDTYLGQYFYFIDARITELGNAYQNKNLSEFIDFTGFYQYQPASDTEPERYNAISIVPNLYYDKYKDDICWKYNGQETGISAIGPKGLDGKDASFLIIFVSNPSETANSGPILGYYDFNADDGKGGIITGTSVPDCFCLIQFVSTTNVNGKTEITEYVDSAFGEVHDDQAYWEDEYRISKLFNNQNITRYFCSMGTDSSIENHPYYFAIPSHIDRKDSSKTEYQYGHVLLSSGNEDLVLQKSTNAFTANGQQVDIVDLELYSEEESDFNIRNYNVNIGYSDGGNSIGGNLSVTNTTTTKDLSVTNTATVGDLEVTVGATVGALDVTGNATVDGNLSVINAATTKDLSVTNTATVGDLEVTGNATVDRGLKVKNTATIDALDVTNNAHIGSNLIVIDDATISGDLGVTGSATISGDLGVTGSAIIGGTLGVTGTASFGNDLIVDGTATIKKGATITGGSFIVNINGTDSFSIKTSGYGISCDDKGTMNINTNDLTIDGGVNIGNSLNVTGNATISGDLGVVSNATISGDLGVVSNATISGDLGVTGNATISGDLGVTGNATISGDLGVTGDATIGGDLGVTGNATISGDLGVTGDATIGGDLGVTGVINGKVCKISNTTKNDYIYNNSTCLEVSAGKSIGNASLIKMNTGVTGASIIGGMGANFDSNTQGGDGGVGLIISGGQGGAGASNERHDYDVSGGAGGTGLIVSGGTGGTGYNRSGYIGSAADGDAILANGNVKIENGTLYIDNNPHINQSRNNIQGLKIETAYKGGFGSKYSNEILVNTHGYADDSIYYKGQAPYGKTALYLKGGSGSQNSGITGVGEWTIGGYGGVGLEVHGGDGGGNFIGQEGDTPSIDDIKDVVEQKVNEGSISYANGGTGIVVKAGFPGTYALGAKTGGTGSGAIGTNALMGKAIEAYGDIYINSHRKKYTSVDPNTGTTEIVEVGANGSLHTEGFVNAGRGFVGIGNTAYISESTYDALSTFTSSSKNPYAYFKEAYSNIMNNGYGKKDLSDTKNTLVFTKEVYKNKGLVIYYQMINRDVILFSAQDPSKGTKKGNTAVILKRGVYFIFLGSKFTYDLGDGHTALDLYHIVDVTGNRVWNSETSKGGDSDWSQLYPQN